MRRLIPAGILILAIAGLGIQKYKPADAPPPPPIIHCQEEDGSSPGQKFPCFWDSGPNGLGASYWLMEADN